MAMARDGRDTAGEGDGDCVGCWSLETALAVGRWISGDGDGAGVGRWIAWALDRDGAGGKTVRGDAGRRRRRAMADGRWTTTMGKDEPRIRAARASALRSGGGAE